MELVESAVVVGIQDEIGNDIIYAFVKRKDEDLNQYDVLDYVHSILDYFTFNSSI
jgi:acyl-coenzyme A synthetase/AMP-(fatty) acid ligase